MNEEFEKQDKQEMTLEQIIRNIELKKTISKFTALSQVPVWLSDKKGNKLFESKNHDFDFNSVNELLFSKHNDANVYLPDAYKEILKQTGEESQKKFVPKEWLIGQVLEDGTLVWAFPITYFNQLLGFLMLSGLCCIKNENINELREKLHIRNDTPFNTNTFCDTKQLPLYAFQKWLNQFAIIGEELVENIHAKKMSMIRIEVTKILKDAHRNHPVTPPKVRIDTEHIVEINAFKRSQSWIASVYYQLCKTIQTKLSVDHFAILIARSESGTLKVVGSSKIPKPTHKYDLAAYDSDKNRQPIKSIDYFHLYKDKSEQSSDSEPLKVQLDNLVPEDKPDDIEELGESFFPARGLWAPMLIQGRRVGLLRILVDKHSLPLREFHKQLFADLAVELNEHLETVIGHYRESIIAALPQLFSPLNFYTPKFFKDHNPFGPVAEGVQRLLNCKAAVIRIKPQDENKLQIVGLSRELSEQRASDLLENAILTKYAIEQKQYVHFEDIYDYQQIINTMNIECISPQLKSDIQKRIQTYKAYKLNSLLSVPVLNEEDQVIGLINAFQGEHITFSEHDVNGVLELAVHLSSFIQVKQLSDNIVKRKQREEDARKFYEQFTISLNQAEQINELHRTIVDKDNKINEYFEPIEIWYCDKLPTFPFMDLIYKTKRLKTKQNKEIEFQECIDTIIAHIKYATSWLQNKTSQNKENNDLELFNHWIKNDLGFAEEQSNEEFYEHLAKKLGNTERGADHEVDKILFPSSEKRYFKIKEILHDSRIIGLQEDDSLYQFYRTDKESTESDKFTIPLKELQDYIEELDNLQKNTLDILPYAPTKLLQKHHEENVPAHEFWLPLYNSDEVRLIGFCKLTTKDSSSIKNDRSFYTNLMDFVARSLATHIERIWRIERKNHASSIGKKFTPNIDPNLFFQQAAEKICEISDAAGCLILGTQSLLRDALTARGYHGFKTNQAIAGRRTNKFIESYIHNELKTTTHYSFIQKQSTLLKKIRRHHYCRIKYIRDLSEQLGTETITSYCAVPIKHANQTIGLIEVFNKKSSQGQTCFSTRDMVILEAIADELGQSLSHYEMIREADSQIAAVVHGGRSPLHAIKGFASNITDYIKAFEKLPEKQEFVLEKLKTFPKTILNTAELAELFIQTTMEEARLKYEHDDDSYEKYKDIYFLAEIERLSSLWETQVNNKNCKLNIVSDKLEGLYFHGSQSQTLLLLSNLIENAVKYSDSDEQITVTGINEKDSVGVEIINLGPRAYSNDEERANLFRSFYRGRNTAGNKGTGIGLPLCKKIVDHYFGKIEYLCERTERAGENHESGYKNIIKFTVPKKGRDVGE